MKDVKKIKDGHETNHYSRKKTPLPSRPSKSVHLHVEGKKERKKKTEKKHKIVKN